MPSDTPEPAPRPQEPAGTDTEPDTRFTFANERTFLAWHRTALALVVAGLAIVQFLPPFPGVPASGQRQEQFLQFRHVELRPGAQWIAAAMGAGLTVAALTNSCAMGMLPSKLPYNRGASCDLDTIIGQLRDTTPSTEPRGGTP